MSLAYNDVTAYKGIVQIYEKEIGVDRGFISGNTTRLTEFTADANLAMDDYWRLAIPASGIWQLDDSNHADYPIIKTNLVSGQRDYAVTNDGNSNLVLDIQRIAILPSATATTYVEIYPTDVPSRPQETGLLYEDGSTGVPRMYDKLGNGIFLDPTPNYSATNGLKLYVNREASYFVYTDATKKPGVPGTHHEYFALNPALKYARRKGLENFSKLELAVSRLEEQIQKDFGKRSRDERNVMTGKRISFI